MRILIVTNYVETKIEFLDLLRFKDFANPDEIDIRYGFPAGKEYIQEYLIQKKKHLDFIIVSRQKTEIIHESNYKEGEADEFALWIRNLMYTYSADNFQIRSIPIILDDENTVYQNLFKQRFSNKYYDLITDIKNIKESVFKNILGSPIHYWLNKLGSELDNLDLNIDFNFDKSLVLKKDSFDVMILSQNFFKRCQKLDYVWIGNNIKKLYVDADMFRKMLDKSSRHKKLKNEKEYHNFFIKNRGLLLGDQYYSMIYENHFYYNMSANYVEPDFVKSSYQYSFTSPQIFEVKLPNQRLISPKKNKISRYLKKGLEQVGNKYFNYFNNTQNQFQINKGLGFIPSSFNYSLLIGRQEEKEENIDIINKYLGSNEQKLDILTYDELIDRYQVIYKRVKKFNLK